MTDDETKAELRQIEKELERDESISALKEKHGITGTREQQKEQIEEKKEELENEKIIPDDNQKETEGV